MVSGMIWDLLMIIATFAGALLGLGILAFVAWMFTINLHPESLPSRLLRLLCPPQQRHSGPLPSLRLRGGQAQRAGRRNR
jgi:hypothetical protein